MTGDILVRQVFHIVIIHLLLWLPIKHHPKDFYLGLVIDLDKCSCCGDISSVWVHLSLSS